MPFVVWFIFKHIKRSSFLPQRRKLSVKGMWRDSIYVLVCQPMARLTGANQNEACNDNRV